MNALKTLQISILCVLSWRFSTGVAEAQFIAYVSNSGSNEVSVIDTTTDSVVATIPVGDGPGWMAATADGTRIYVANFNSNNVSVVETLTNTVAATIAVGTGPTAITVKPDGTRAYVANRGTHDVSVIDTATNTVIAAVPVGTDPGALDITLDGARLYVANRVSNDVSVIDSLSNTVLATVAVGALPHDVAIIPDGSQVYIPNYSGNTVSVIDTSTHLVSSTIPAGSNPNGAVITPDGTQAYVGNTNSGDLTAIDTSSETATGTIPAGVRPVGNQAFILPDGTKLYVPNQSTDDVTVIDTASNTVVTTISIGDGPRVAAATPDGKRGYFPNLTSNDVSVVDTTTDTVTATIQVGSGPFQVIVVAPPFDCVDPPPDLVGWWPGDGDAADIVGVNDGTLVGATFAPGQVGETFAFDGVDDYVEVSDHPSLRPASSMTVDAWVFWNGPAATYNRIISKNRASFAGGISYQLVIVGSQLFFGISVDSTPTGSAINAVDPNSFGVNAWHHVAGTYDGTALRLYVDGLEVANQAVSGAIAYDAEPLVFGRYDGAYGEYFDGLIDEVELFDRALSTSEIQSIVAAGSAGKCKTLVIDFESFDPCDHGKRFGPCLDKTYEQFDWAYGDPTKVALWGNWTVQDTDTTVDGVSGSENWLKARAADVGKGAKITRREGFFFESMYLYTDEDQPAFLDVVEITWREIDGTRSPGVIFDLVDDSWEEVTAQDLGIDGVELKAMWFNGPGIEDPDAAKFGLDDFSFRKSP